MLPHWRARILALRLLKPSMLLIAHAMDAPTLASMPCCTLVN